MIEPTLTLLSYIGVFVGGFTAGILFETHIIEMPRATWKRPICWVRGHDWRSGQMYATGWTDTCHRCGDERVIHR